MPKGPITWTDDDVMDEIERLTADCDNLRNTITSMQIALKELQADKSAWEASAQANYEALSEANKRIAELEAELDGWKSSCDSGAVGEYFTTALQEVDDE